MIYLSIRFPPSFVTFNLPSVFGDSFVDPPVLCLSSFVAFSLPAVFGDRFEDSTGATPTEVRSAGTQALMQLAALVMTLAIAIVSGLFTGSLSLHLVHIEPLFPLQIGHTDKSFRLFVRFSISSF